MVRRPRRALWRGIAAAAVAAACVDGPTAPGRFGELRVRPAYQPGDEPAALAVSLDSATVRVTRGAEPDEPLVDTRVGYRSDTASLGWVLDLRTTAESLRVEVALWGGGTRFYQGVDTVEVRDAALGVAAEPVAVDYVGPAIVATVTVTPAVATLDALDATTPLVAEARDRHGALVGGATLAWSSSDVAVATVDPARGLVTARGNGTTTVTATSGTRSGTATLVVRQRVAALTVSPSTATLTALGATQALAAQARDANGHPVADAVVTWTSDAPAIARVEAATGLVTAVAGGSATITATSDAMAATALVTVNPIADVASITITPAAATLLAAAATQQFSAVARDAGGAVLAGVQFTWTSSVPSVATVDAAGLARAAGHGATVITAGAGAATGTAALTVDLGATIAAVTVSPAAATLTAVGAVQPFTAVARDAGGAVVPVASFAWSSSAPAIAQIDAAGLATAVSHGAATIRAAVAGVSGAANLSVDLGATIAVIEVSPGSATLTAPGTTQPFTAVARDAAGGVVPGVPFVWSSSTPGVAAIDQTGLATAAGHGATTITATSGGRHGSAALTVNFTVRVASVLVEPGNATLTAVGAMQPFTAVARDAGGAVLPGVEFAWTSSAPAVAPVGATGVATAQAHGQTTIAATANGVSGQARLTVDLTEQIASVAVAPAGATLGAVAATQAFTAVARDAGGAVVPVASFAWTSSVPGVATVGPATGLATAVSHGATTIRAAVSGVFGEANLTVDLAPAVASVSVSPPGVTLAAVGATQPFTAVVRDAAGRELPGVSVAWSSGTTAVATIDPLTGLATAARHGSTTITATAAGVSGTARLTVDLTEAVANVTVSPPSATLTALSATQAFTAVARDANGAEVPGVPIAWSSGTPGVATVDPLSGVAIATGQGATVITATAGGRHGTAALRVDLTPSVASVVVTPPDGVLTTVGATLGFVAVARDAAGAVLPGIVFAWTSSASAVATVGPAGVATAQAHGRTTIAASANGVSGAALLTVDLSPTFVSVAVTPAAATLTAIGATRQFEAEARDANGNVVPVAGFEWSSSASSVATVDPLTGLATAAGHGAATIRATVAGLSGDASLTVDLTATVASVAVTPASARLTAVGATQLFTAVASDAGGNQIPGMTFTWSSAEPAVASVSAAGGLATAVGHGNTSVTAAAGGVSGSAALTVDLTAAVVSVVITPESAMLHALGATRQFTAVARDAAGQIVTGVPITWASATAVVATIDAVTGVATARGHGTTAITATAAGVTGAAELRVDLTSSIATITIEPATAELEAIGATQQYTATARDASGRILPGVPIEWASSDPAVATIGAANGLATAAGNGTTTITASSAGIVGRATLEVDVEVSRPRR